MPAKKQFPSWIKLLLKITVTVICLWYVSKKIDWSKSFETIGHSNLAWLLVGMLMFIASKTVSSLRLNVYFRNIDLFLPEKINLKLYWLAMFYNLFLPGGIGGDAYKVILLNRHFAQTAKQLTAAVLLDRISGAVGLGILAVIYNYFVFKGGNYSLWLLAALLPGLVLFYFFVKKIFPSFLKGFWAVLWLGILVQALQVLCAYAIMQALHIYTHQTEYILIFLLSSIVAILPFTVGGLGARELVFVWGSTNFGLNQNQSVAISLWFYLITLVVSLAGLYWEYDNPLKKDNFEPGYGNTD